MKDIDADFKRYMKWWEMEYSPYSLIKGDFSDPALNDKITSATFIFVNELGLNPELDVQLKGKISRATDNSLFFQ